MMDKKNSKSLALAAVVLVFLVLSLSVAVPALWPDGTERFTGVRREAAVRALRDAEVLLDGNESMGDLKVYVVDVRPIQKGDLEGWCSNSPRLGSTRSASDYSVVLSHRTIFGIETRRWTIPGCSEGF